MKKYLTRNHAVKIAAAAALAVVPGSLIAQTTLDEGTVMSTYVSSANPTSNYGGKGAMEIAVATSAQNNVEYSVFQFNTATLASQFNTLYGAGNWAVSSVTLSLFSNFATGGVQPNNSSFNVIAAGGFELDLLSDNSWSQGTLTWNNVSTILPGTGGNTSTSLGDFNYAANGTSPVTWTLGTPANLLSDIDTGSDVTVFGQPTADSTVGYLFNTTTQGNPPLLNVTVEEVPEPGTIALLVSGLAGVITFRRRKNQL